MVKNYLPNPKWIRYGSLKTTPKETKIELLLFAAHHYYETFKNKQSLSSINTRKWPLMNPKQWSHSAWLKRAHNEQLFDVDWLYELEHAHENMHMIARDIMIKHQNKNAHVTTEDHNKLQQVFEVMMSILKPETIFTSPLESV